MSKEKQLVTHQPQTTAVSIFNNLEDFPKWELMAEKLCKGTIVPKRYQGPANKSNCLIALDIAVRAGVSPLMIMQQLNIIQGQPSFSAKYLIAQVDQSGRYTKLDFTMEQRGKKDVSYTYYVGTYPNRKEQTGVVKGVHDYRCRATATEISTGKKLVGPWVSIEIAIKDGWYTKKGSKWPYMAEKMLQYRAASDWVSLHSPSTSMGLKTTEEIIDIGHEEVADNPNPIVHLNNISTDEKPPAKEEIEEATIVNEEEGKTSNGEPETGSSDHAPKETVSDNKTSEIKEDKPLI